MPIGQGERWLYGDEEARGNPEETIAGQNGEPGPIVTHAQEVASQAAGDATAASAAASAAQAAASAAQTAANLAQADATQALEDLADIASDSVLSPGEKPFVIADKAAIDAEYQAAYDLGTTYGNTTERDAYAAAKTALDNYLATLTSPVAWNNTSGNTTISGAIFRQYFTDYYTARGALFNANSADARALANQGINDAAAAAQDAADALAAAQLRALTDLSNVIAQSVTATLLATDAVTAQKIATGAVELSKFGTGLRPVQTVAALPTLPDASYPQGATVFLTSDNKLYRSTGSAWTAAVPTVDLSGQITGTQITDQAITTAKLAALAVTAAQIAANAITSEKIDALAVTAGKIAANAITTEKLDALAVTAGKIAAGAIVAGKIGADAVGANEIAANAITAIKILAGAITAEKLAANVIRTTDFAEDADLVPTSGAAMVAASDATVYAAGTTYALNAVVVSAGKVYRSLQNSNTGNTPASSPTWWELFPPLRVGPGGMKIGSFLMDELKSAALSAIARADVNAGLVWYRGNAMGIPVLIDPPWTQGTAYAIGDRVCGDPSPAGYPITTNRDGLTGAARYVYICTQAGTSAASGNGPTGTGTSIVDNTVRWDYVGTIAAEERLLIYCYQTLANYIFTFRFDLVPRTDKDNFDAIRYAKLEFFQNNKGVITGHNVVYQPIPDRRYETPGTPTSINNRSYVTVYWTNPGQWYYNGNNFPFNGWIRVTLYTAAGRSATRDYDFSAAQSAPYSGLAGGWTLGGLSGGGGGGGGGGGCVAPETPIFIAPGVTKPIGEIRPGDLVWTRPEDGGPLGYYRVSAARLTENLRLMITFKDGRFFVCSINHLLNVRGVWRRADTLMTGEEIQGDPNGYIQDVEYLGIGPVVKLSVPGAKTYLAGDGAWHHNVLKE